MKKKKKHLLILVFATILISTRIASNKEEETIDLFLRNIECLATLEDWKPTCYSPGSLDCPSNNTKAYMYLYEE